MEIRRYHADDLDALYDIAVLTGDAGEDATGIYDDDRLLGHVFVGPYTTLQPGLAFVAADADGVAGYVLGALDARELEGALERTWWPDLRRRYPIDRPVERPDRWLVERIHRPVLAPDEILDRYPSEFHIDLLTRCRGHGVGRRLIDRLLTELRAADSPGVHCGVDERNERAIGFYAHLGFERVDRSGGPMFVLGL